MNAAIVLPNRCDRFRFGQPLRLKCEKSDTTLSSSGFKIETEKKRYKMIGNFVSNAIFRWQRLT